MATFEGQGRGSFAGKVTVKKGGKSGSTTGGGGGGSRSITGSNVKGSGSLSNVTAKSGGKIADAAAVASSPAVKGGYTAESYKALSPEERAKVDSFYQKNPPLGAVVAGEPGAMLVSYGGSPAKTAGELTRRLAAQDAQYSYRATSYKGRSLPSTAEYRAKQEQERRALQGSYEYSTVDDQGREVWGKGTPEPQRSPTTEVKGEPYRLSGRDAVLLSSRINNPGRTLASARPVQEFSRGAVDIVPSTVRGSYKLFTGTEGVPGTLFRLPEGKNLLERSQTAQRLLRDPDVQTAGLVSLAPVAASIPAVGNAVRWSVPVITAYDITQTAKNPTPFNIGRSTTNVGLSVLALSAPVERLGTVPAPEGTVSFSSFGKRVSEVSGQSVRPMKATPSVAVTEYTAGTSAVKITETAAGVYTRVKSPRVDTFIARSKAPTKVYGEFNLFGRKVVLREAPSQQVTQVKTGDSITITRKVSEPVKGIDAVKITPQATKNKISQYSQGQPDKSIVTQKATQEATTTYAGTIGGKPIAGDIFTASRTRTISYSGKTSFKATDTPADITMDLNVRTQPTETVFSGTTPTRLRVAKNNRIANEFVITKNKLLPSQEPSVFVTEIEGARLKDPVPTGEVNLFGSSLRRPFIESSIEQRQVSAGYLYVGEVKPTMQTIKEPKLPQFKDSPSIPKTESKGKTGRTVLETEKVSEVEPVTVQQLRVTPSTQEPFIIGFTDTTRTTLPTIGIRPSTVTTPSSDTRVSNVITPSYASISRVDPITIPRIRSRQDNAADTRNAQEPVYSSRSSYSVRQVQEQIQETEPVLELEQVSVLTGRTVPFELPRIRVPREQPIVIPAFTTPKKSREQEIGYSLFVRKSGRFTPIGRGFGIKEAFERGVGITRGTAAASFKVVGEEEGIDTGEREFLPRSYYASKKEKNVFVQRRGTRITSAGEKAEITLKGIMTARFKKRR
jgi:hypothetical protein